MVKNPLANAGDAGLIPESGRFPGEGNGNPLQYSCLENPMHRGAWWAAVHGVAESQTRLSMGMIYLSYKVHPPPQTFYYEEFQIYRKGERNVK